MRFHQVPVRRVRAGLGLAALAVMACAGERPEPEVSLPTRRAVHEAIEELPGVVLSDRHFAAAGALRVTVAAPDEAGARSALETAFAIADSIDKLVSPHLPGSEVSRLNAAAGREPLRVSPWTETMVVVALEWAARTGGAFDPTVGPVVTAWGFGSDIVAVPTNERLEAAQRLVGWDKLRHDPAAHTVFLSQAGMELDLRSLAKGFALDRMRDAMLANGATGGVADYDGDLLFFGPGTESHADLWPIEVPDPYDPNRPFARFEIPAGGFSISTYYERVIEIEGERYGHVIDPRTGWPVRGVASVSVYASQAVVNDILSTALFVMGVEDGMRLALELHDVEAMFALDAEPGGTSDVEMTPAFRRYLKELEPPRRPLAPEDE